jgi:hypothetical protein
VLLKQEQGLLNTGGLYLNTLDIGISGKFAIENRHMT